MPKCKANKNHRERLAKRNKLIKAAMALLNNNQPVEVAENKYEVRHTDGSIVEGEKV